MTLPVRPSRAGVMVSGPFSGNPSTAASSPFPAVSESGSGGAPSPSTASRARSLRRVVVDGGRLELGPALDAHRRVVLAGDHVRVGDHQAGRRDPARALDPEPAGGPEHAHGRAAGRPHLGVVGGGRVGRRHVGVRPPHRRRRVDAPEHVEQGPEGGRTSLRAPRIADCCTASRRSRDRSPVACRATAPNPQQTSSASAASSTAPPSAVERAQRGCRSGAPAQPPGEPVEGDREERSDQHPGDRRDQRRVRDSAPSGEQLRPDPRAERGAADEAGQRQRAGDQSALVADRGERDHEEDDADVDEAHASGAGKATTFSRMIIGSQMLRGGTAHASDRARIEAD